jgi:anaerobic magnesium-protoporphyrin IX monomethyl ester cyclase
MSRPQVLLVNPTMVARRHARFPLSLLALAQRLEATHAVTLIDGNVDRDTTTELQRTLANGHFEAVGVTVMGGPQVGSAIEVSRAVRALAPSTPIVWGGYFPSLYPATALNASYVDYAVRGQGEDTFSELLARLGGPRPDGLRGIAGLSWRDGAEPVHNAERTAAAPRASLLASYGLLGDPRRYLARTVLGARTVAHQGAIGCRFRCTFCGVAAMFRGATHLPPAELLAQDLAQLKGHFGADSVQFYDHNFFDREEDMLPLLEVLARAELPWWCYARADALIGLSAEAWSLVRRSRLRMAYIGAESPNDQLLREIRKGTRADQTLKVAELCRRHGVIPELSFMVAPPVDPEGETERTFEFIRQLKRVNPAAEIIVYIYTPLPPDSVPARLRNRLAPLRAADGTVLRFPSTPEEWTERRWIDYACHADAPWLSARLRRRIRDFVTVLKCRFPTVQDTRTPRWAAGVLRATAAWRYRLRRYDRPWELELARRVIPLGDPQTTSL